MIVDNVRHNFQEKKSLDEIFKKKTSLAGLDHQNSIVFSTLIGEIKALEKKLSDHNSQLKKFERSVDFIKERTGLEHSKELTDSSESSSYESNRPKNSG